MTENANHLVTFKGRPVTLIGKQVKVGELARDFSVLANDLTEISLKDTAAKIRVINVVFSLETSICDIQTRKFNEELAQFAEKVDVMTISMDLPFAQARWCSASGLKNVRTYSDHRDAHFGVAFGVLIKELRLLARSVFILDADNKVRYADYVSEVSTHPDYSAALAAVKALL